MVSRFMMRNHSHEDKTLIGTDDTTMVDKPNNGMSTNSPFAIFKKSIWMTHHHCCVCHMIRQRRNNRKEMKNLVVVKEEPKHVSDDIQTTSMDNDTSSLSSYP